MQKTETKNYISLEIEVVEVQMEKGYATSGNGLNGMGNDGAGW